MRGGVNLMAPRTFVNLLAAMLAVGCVGVPAETRLREPGEGSLLVRTTFPVAISDVKLSEGADIYWQPAMLRSLPMQADRMQVRVKRLLREELDRAGFRNDHKSASWLEVTIEEIALVTRGFEDGYREGYAEMRFVLRSGGAVVADEVQIGEIRYEGSGVRQTDEGSFLSPLYVYEDPDPDPVDHAIRQATRQFLLNLRPD
jgi:hypothetical protein